ncbi:MAG: CHAP domain-containing protein [Eubacteriales bacterium]
MKKQSRLQFTNEERADPFLKKAVVKGENKCSPSASVISLLQASEITGLKSEKMANKVEKAQGKIPQKKKLVMKYQVDEAAGKKKSVSLQFEKVEQKRPSSHLSHTTKQASKKMMQDTFHKKIRENEKDNAGVEMAHKIEQVGEVSARQVQNTYHSHKLKPYKKLENAEKKSIKADVEYLYKKSIQDNPQARSNPISKWKQKQRIKKQYVAQRYQKGATTTNQAVNTVKDVLYKGTNLMKNAVVTMLRNPKVMVGVIAILLIIGLVSTIATSCTVLLQGVITGVVSTSYTSENEELIATNDAYKSMEQELQNEINQIETKYPNFDEYRYDLDAIAHDPHQLVSYLTAKYQYFTAKEMESELEYIFAKQYQLTITEVVEVPYNYYVLQVKLQSKTIDEIVRGLLTSEELERYEIYLATSGNKPLLFGGGSMNVNPSVMLSDIAFVEGVRTGNEAIVQIALEQVGNVGGQPYWSWYGFDTRVEWCACYVSWVLQQAGYSEPRFSACQSEGVTYFLETGRWVDREDTSIASGDVIFFDWEDDGSADHVGIVIGMDENKDMEEM